MFLVLDDGDTCNRSCAGNRGPSFTGKKISLPSAWSRRTTRIVVPSGRFQVSIFPASKSLPPPDFCSRECEPLGPIRGLFLPLSAGRPCTGRHLNSPGCSGSALQRNGNSSPVFFCSSVPFRGGVVLWLGSVDSG